MHIFSHNSVPINDLINSFVSLSKCAAASSKINKSEESDFISARAIATFCISPPESFTFSPTKVLSFKGRLSINCFNPDFFSAVSYFSSLTSPAIFILFYIVSLNKNIFCETIDILLLKDLFESFFKSIEFIKISPS